MASRGWKGLNLNTALADACSLEYVVSNGAVNGE